MPNCTHYLPKKMVLGHVSLCNICNNPFVMDKHAMRLAKPRCNDCRQTKEGVNVKLVALFDE